MLEAPNKASRVGCTRFLPEEEGAERADTLSRVTGVEAGCVGERGVAAASDDTGGRGELAKAEEAAVGRGAAALPAEGTRPKDSATDAGAAFATGAQGAAKSVGAMRFFFGGSAAAGPSRTAFSSREGGSSTVNTSAGVAAAAGGDSQGLDRPTAAAGRATESVAQPSEGSMAPRGVATVALAGVL